MQFKQVEFCTLGFVLQFGDTGVHEFTEERNVEQVVVGQVIRLVLERDSLELEQNKQVNSIVFEKAFDK